jgi:hypothetical protein
MDKYLLLLREDPNQYASLSPDDMQALIERYRRWSNALAQQGRLVEGHKLADEGGKRLRASADQAIVTDGPYAELKDLIGGLFIIQAESYDDAVRLARDCPHLHTDNEIELRRIETMDDER